MNAVVIDGVDVTSELRRLTAENAKLQRFKDYVHERLTADGVPVDPDPNKTAETGCRIGGRMDYMTAERDKLRAWQANARRLLRLMIEGRKNPLDLLFKVLEFERKLASDVIELPVPAREAKASA